MDELTPKAKEGSLAARQETKPVQRKTRKRSRVELNPETASSGITDGKTAVQPTSAQGMAISAVDAFKSAAANAYTEEMKQAVPELFVFFDEVNNQVADYMIGQIDQAYGVMAEAGEV